MECKSCPYGEYDFNRRVACYKKIVQERGIPNDIYGNLNYEDAVKEFEEFLWCDKVGGKIFWAYTCEDSCIEIPENKIYFRKKKRKSKRERNLKYKNHLKFLSENILSIPSPVKYIDKIRINKNDYIDLPKSYYKRIYRDKGKSSYSKKMSNKKIRKYKGDIPIKGNYCHKLYDFWRKIY